MSMRRNALANYAGQAWTGLLGVAFIPLYISYLGVAAYGLVGVFAMLQAAMALMDTGMTPTVNREMARYVAGARSLETTLDLLRSLEVIYLGLGVLLVACVWFAAPWLATHWFKSGSLPPQQIADSLVVMALVVALKTCEIAYRGAIQGLQHQVWLNGAQAVLATLRWVGVLGVLALSPTINAYFLWQGFVSLLTVLVFARKTYHWLPATPHRARFNLESLRGVARFAGGLMGVTLASVVLAQTDKILLSKFFPLEVLGYYTVAATVAAMLAVFVYPISNALYPRLSELVAAGDVEGERQAYISATQWLSVIIVPPAVTLAVFAEPALLAWSNDPGLSRQAAPIVSLLVLGNLMNGFMNPPYNLQLAHGWTGLSMKANIVAIFMIVPAQFLIVPHYGAVGVAAVWLALNVGFVLFVSHVMHRRILPDQKWVWYRSAVFAPFLGGGMAALTIGAVAPVGNGRAMTIVWLAISGIVVGFVTILFVPQPRSFFLERARAFGLISF